MHSRPPCRSTADIRIPGRIEGLTVQVKIPVRVIPLAGDAESFVPRPSLQNGHLVLREGSGLVRTDHRGAAEGLDRGKLADQGVAADHLLHPQGQADGHDRRQPFRHGGDRQADGRHEQIDDVGLLGGQIVEKADIENAHQMGVADEAVDEDDAADDQADRPEDLAQLLQLLLEGGGLLS